jgi:hypothetical protein
LLISTTTIITIVAAAVSGMAQLSQRHGDRRSGVAQWTMASVRAIVPAIA